MRPEGDDLDATRAQIARGDLMAGAVGRLTTDVAMRLAPEDLPRFKTSLKRFFSTEPWTEADADELAAVVAVPVPWTEHDLGDGITLGYGDRHGRFTLTAGGASGAGSVFDRVFDGPVKPEATPHPRKVRFVFGGVPAPGVWYRRGDETDDERLARIFAEEDVTDVMVAGDFVTIGIDGDWEQRLDPMLALVTVLFEGGVSETPPERTRAELLTEAGTVTSPGEELHLLDPDDAEHRRRLQASLADESPAVRRMAVAILAESADAAVRAEAIERGLGDGTLRVRRTALDVAGDAGDEAFRADFERIAATDPDPWSRWRAVRALGDLGADPSRDVIESLLDDVEFRVRFEAERILRTA